MKRPLHKDQRGISHVLLAILLIVVFAGVVFAAWRVQQHNKNSTKVASSNTSCMDVYHDGVICNFENNANFNQLSYTAAINSANSQGQTTQITLKNDGKGDTSIASQAGNQTYNSIIIGKTTYVQDGSSWIKYNSNAPTSQSPTNNLNFKFSDAATPEKQRVTYKRLGKESCGNGTCYKYQVSGPTSFGTTYIWISTNNYRLERLLNKSNEGTTTITVTYEPVTITAPSPTTTPSAAASQTYDSWVQQYQQQYMGQSQ